MIKKHLIFTLALIIMVVFAVGCGGDKTVIEFSGDSSERSEPFEISNKKTQLRIHVREEDGQGGEESVKFDVFVVPEGEAIKDKSDPDVTEHEPESKTITIHKTPGTYILDVRSNNAEWTVSIIEAPNND